MSRGKSSQRTEGCHRSRLFYYLWFWNTTHRCSVCVPFDLSFYICNAVHLLLQWVSGNFRIALKMLLIIYKAQSIDRPVLTGSTSQSFQSSDQYLFIVSCSYFKPSQGCGQYNGPLISTVTYNVQIHQVADWGLSLWSFVEWHFLSMLAWDFSWVLQLSQSKDLQKI